MVKFAIVLLVAALAVVNAGSLRQRVSSNRRVLARQEVAEEAAITPYPSADELKPEVPFDEAAELPAVADEAEELPAVADEAEELPAVVADEEAPEGTLNNIPDEVYGPPESELNTVEPAAEQLPVPLDAEEARLIAQYRSAKLRQRQAAYRKAAALKRRSAKLRAAKKISNKA